MKWSWSVLLALSLAGCDGCDSPAAPVPGTSAAPKIVHASASPPPRKSAGAPPGSASATKKAWVPARELTWSYDDTPAGGLDVVIYVPPHEQDSKLPVLFAFHGRGEALKGPKRGARGWVEDYWLPQADVRLRTGKVSVGDLLVSDDAHAEKLNAALAAHPYRGVIVVCPYTPDIMVKPRSLDAASDYGRWLVKTLLPRVDKELPTIGGRLSTGIDGVSLGGRLSVLVGFERPEAFGVVGGIQPAFDSAEAGEVARRAKAAREKHTQTVRLLTSEGDFFLNPTRQLSSALKEVDVPNQLDVVPGPHDYDFNRGPGAHELLLFYDGALRPHP
ncbi:MAG: alpha/beta hydrolase-fold protein [Polyangiaceae bacterium]